MLRRLLSPLLSPLRSPFGVAAIVFGVMGAAVAFGPANACEMGALDAEGSLEDLMARVDEAAQDTFEDAVDVAGAALTRAGRALSAAAEAAIDAGTERVVLAVDAAEAGDTGAQRDALAVAEVEPQS